MDAALGFLLLPAVLLFCGYLLLFTLYTGSVIFTWPPSIPTDGKTRRRMAARAAEHAAKLDKPQPLILDLGSGFGHLAESCARAVPQARVCGYERFIVSYAGSRVRALLRAALFRTGKPRFIYGDFFKDAPIEEADIIVCFLIKGALMERFRAEIWPRLSPGTRLICNGAAVPGMTPDAEEEIRYVFGKRNIYIYDQRKQK